MKDKIPEKVIQEYKVFRDRNVVYANQRLRHLLRSSNKTGEKNE